jgi:alpha-1,6-mannosyltransferase
MVANWRANVPRSLIMHADPLGNYAYRWFRRVASRRVIDRGFDWFWQRLRRLDDCFDHVVCASTDLAQRLREGGLRNTVFNPMGVQPGLFSAANRDPNLRRHLLSQCHLDEDAILLIGAGRHAPEKRWPMIVEAVTACGYEWPIALMIAGDGRSTAAVQKAVSGNPHIRLIPPILDRRKFATFLASGDALVHGSESETFCMIAAEARASGVPMLLPDSGAAREHLVEGAGHHYASANAASLAQTIRQFAKEGRAGHQLTARSAARGTRTMDAHFEDLFRLYGEGRGTADLAYGRSGQILPRSMYHPHAANSSVMVKNRHAFLRRSERDLCSLTNGTDAIWTNRKAPLAALNVLPAFGMKQTISPGPAELPGPIGLPCETFSPHFVQECGRAKQAHDDCQQAHEKQAAALAPYRP